MLTPSAPTPAEPRPGTNFSMQDRASAGIFLHRVDAPWGGAVADPALAGNSGVTWSVRNTTERALWSTPGGDFEPEASAGIDGDGRSTAAGAVSCTPDGHVGFTLTSTCRRSLESEQLLADVQVHETSGD